MVDRPFHVSRLCLKRRGQSIYHFRSFVIVTRRAPFHHHLQPIFLKKGLSVLDAVLRSLHLRSVTFFPFLHDDTPPYHTTATHTSISSSVLSCSRSIVYPFLSQSCTRTHHTTPTSPITSPVSFSISRTARSDAPLLNGCYLLTYCPPLTFSTYVRTDCASVTR